jgi:hypothetical protein
VLLHGIGRIDYGDAMSEISDIAEQRDRGGRFVIGGKAGPGRPKGARSRLSEAFISDLHTVWEEAGITALRVCAAERPNEFCRLVALLMPRDLNLSIGLDGASFARTFEQAVALLGNEPPRHRPRLPNDPRLIEHGRQR